MMPVALTTCLLPMAEVLPKKVSLPAVRAVGKILCMIYSANPWSLCVGRLRGIEIRLHILFPLLALGLAPFVQSTSLQPALQPVVALWGLGILLISATVHELARVIAVLRLGGQVSQCVIAPFGSWSRVQLPSDPPAHLATALVGPMTCLALLITGGCGLALAGDREVYRLLYAWAPHDVPGFRSPATISPTNTAILVCQLFVWINWRLLLIDLLPVDPCAGATLLRGMLWPIVGRESATIATSRLALGGSLLTAMAACLVLKYDSSGGMVPSWLPWGIISVLQLYGGLRDTQIQEPGTAIDAWDADDPGWPHNQWREDQRETVLVEQLQDKQQAALDRKRQAQEVNEDARVDAILQRLHDTSLDQLSEEERAILKRASRRYRERRDALDS